MASIVAGVASLAWGMATTVVPGAVYVASVALRTVFTAALATLSTAVPLLVTALQYALHGVWCAVTGAHTVLQLLLAALIPASMWLIHALGTTIAFVAKAAAFTATWALYIVLGGAGSVLTWLGRVLVYCAVWLTSPEHRLDGVIHDAAAANILDTSSFVPLKSQNFLTRLLFATLHVCAGLAMFSLNLVRGGLLFWACLHCVRATTVALHRNRLPGWRTAAAFVLALWHLPALSTLGPFVGFVAAAALRLWAKGMFGKGRPAGRGAARMQPMRRLEDQPARGRDEHCNHGSKRTVPDAATSSAGSSGGTTTTPAGTKHTAGDAGAADTGAGAGAGAGVGAGAVGDHAHGGIAALPECAICLEDLHEHGRCAALKPCGHNAFHQRCIKSWLGISLFCPMCRRECTLPDGGRMT